MLVLKIHTKNYIDAEIVHYVQFDILVLLILNFKVNIDFPDNGASERIRCHRNLATSARLDR